jgi:hypothetical protein
MPPDRPPSRQAAAGRRLPASEVRSIIKGGLILILLLCGIGVVLLLAVRWLFEQVVFDVLLWVALLVGAAFALRHFLQKNARR